MLRFGELATTKALIKAFKTYGKPINKGGAIMTDETGRVRYYHGRDYEGKPRATVCLMSVNNRDGSVDVAKGVSICSDEDAPNKFIGRKRSWARALKALKSQESTGYIYSDKAWGVLNELDLDCFALVFSSAFNPTLSDLDKKLLEI